MIAFDYNGTQYELGFSRRTVKVLESQGFSVQQLNDKPGTMIPLLFRGSFLMNHPNVKEDTVNAIYKKLNNKTELISALVESYAETVSSLFDDSDEGNLNWSVK